MHRFSVLRSIVFLLLIIPISGQSETRKLYGVFDLPVFEDFGSLRARIPQISSFSEMELYFYTKANNRYGFAEIEDLPDRLLFFYTSGGELNGRIRFPGNRRPNLFVTAVILLYDPDGRIIGAARYPITNSECSGRLGGRDVPHYIQFQFGPARNAEKFLLKYEEAFDIERGEKCDSG